jgi:hypothetical protein
LSAPEWQGLVQGGKAWAVWADRDLVGIIEHQGTGSGVSDTRRAAGVPLARRLERPGGADPSGEPVVELVAGGSADQSVKVVGPGRKERTYLDRIRLLEEEAGVKERSLETAGLIERGSLNLLDRMERQLDSGEEALERERAASRRVCVMLGALQRESEVLREELEVARGQLARLEGPRKQPLWRRLLGS